MASAEFQPDRLRKAVAIVGMGCRFAGAGNLREFWAMLRDGVEAVSEIPAERFGAWASIHDPRPGTPGRLVSRRGGFLAGLDQFDPCPFGIAPREAAFLDPQQRLLLEVTWEALEAAGLPLERVAGLRAGVYVGLWTGDYENRMYDATGCVNLYMVTGAGRHSAAGRLSHVFNLRGPSLMVDSGCSSSLVAVHLACQSLLAGESELAVAGGANVILQPPITVAFSGARMLSADGRCKFGDARADGYVRSEGAGVVVLKRLSDARRDGDPVQAVILGSAVNHDGQEGQFLTPSQRGQEGLLRAACAAAGVAPEHLQYIEAHGTGTAAGDPVELKALGAVLGAAAGRKTPLLVGSVKTNIGHTEAAAGMAGLIKTVLALQQRQIPPSLHFTQPNPNIPWEKLPLEIPTKAKAWPEGENAPLAGVNSFGVAGTSAHVIVTAGIERDVGADGEEAGERAWLVPISAHSPEALRALARSWREFLLEEGSDSGPAAALADLCYTAAVRRSHHEHRLGIAGRRRTELAKRLEAWLEETQDAGGGQCAGTPPGGLAFVFPGQGGQWHAMGRALMAHEPVYRACIERCDALLRQYVDWSLLAELDADEDTSRINRTDLTQPALFALQLGLSELLRSWGIQPDAIVGHSSGEVAAACAAGALSMEAGIRIIVHRGRLQQQQAGRGLMAATDLTLEEAGRMLARHADRIGVATINSGRSLTLAGTPEAVTEIVADLERQGRFARLLHVDIASHSPQMESCMAELTAAVRGIAAAAPRTPLISTVTGCEAADGDFGAAYWARNIRQPVRFADAMATLIGRGITTYVELGPHPVLALSIEQCLAERGAHGTALPALRRGEDEPVTLRDTLGELYARGHAVAWQALHPDGGQVVALPSYPWQRERFWYEDMLEDAERPSWGAGGQACKARVHPLLDWHCEPVEAGGGHSFLGQLDARRSPWLKDHQVQEARVVPAAALCELMLAAADEAFGAGLHAMEEVRLLEALIVPANGARVMQVTLDPATPGLASCRIFSRPAAAKRDEAQQASGADGAEWICHARATIELGCPEDEPAQAEILSPPPPEWEGEVDGETHLRRMRERGLAYGPVFQSIERMWLGEGEATGWLRVAVDETWREQAAESARPGRLTPPLIDGGLQLLVALAAARERATDRPGPYLPIRIERLEFGPDADLKTGLWARATCLGDQAPSTGIAGDVVWIDGQGRLALAARGVTLTRMERTVKDPQSLMHTIEWTPVALPVRDESSAMLFEQSIMLAVNPGREPAQCGMTSGRWLIFADDGGVGERLAELLRERGGQCVLVRPNRGEPRVDPQSPEQFTALLGTLNADRATPIKGAIYLWALDEPTFEELEGHGGAALAQSQARTGAGALHLTQALGRLETAAMPRLWLVTRGAQPAGDGPPTGAAQATLWGLGRVTQLEHPVLRCTLVDLDPQGTVEKAGANLFTELLLDDHELLAAWRGGERFGARLTPLYPATAVKGERRLTRPSHRPCRLHLTQPGSPDHLALRATRRREPGAGQVEIRMLAAGLNFRDVWVSLGMLPGDDERLGLECAGVVERIGAGVQGLHPGDSVLAFATESFGSYVIADARFTVPMPPGLAPAAAATVPVAFLTAAWGLRHLARLAPGESVLIHAASGGVGLAALQIAQAAGARTLGTAGSPHKRQFLKEMGVEQVFDSRSPDFAEKVLAATEGRGVDVVLNSLAGEFIPQSLAALARGGRFIEIGKRGIWTADQVREVRPDCEYAPFDLIEVARREPERIARLLHSLTDKVVKGELTPLPYRVFELEEAVNAFRHMAAARHIGKVVLANGTPSSITVTDRLKMREDAAYLITGGLGGLGLATARWLASRGARRLALAGRGAPGEHARALIAELEAQGVRVLTLAADVAQAGAVERLVARVEAELGPLAGVVHAAGVLADGALLSQSWERFERVLAPKALGAWALHRATRHRALDFFVLYSSTAAVLGSPGQANHAAANAFLDTLAHWRRGRGLAALSINWGPWAEVGAAADGEGAQWLAGLGLRGFGPDQGVAALERLLAGEATQAAVMQLDTARWRASHPLLAKSPYLERLCTEPETREEQSTGNARPAEEDVRQALLAAAAGPARRQVMEGHLRKQVSRVLRLAESRVSAHRPFKSMGLDSLTGLELRNRLEASLGLTLPASLVWNYPTLDDLGPHLASLMGLPLNGEATGAPESATEEDTELASLLSELETLSDDEARRRLVQEETGA